MNKYQAIMYLYPEADPLRDFTVRDDGERLDILKIYP